MKTPRSNPWILLNIQNLNLLINNSEGQGSLVCCSPWGGKESDMTEQLSTHTANGLSSLSFPITDYHINLSEIDF